MSKYEPIEDWSHAGRRALVAQHGYQIRLLLDEAFTRQADMTSLAAFGFLPLDNDGDVVTAAVEWCVERFQNGDLDPRQLRPDSRSLRLFTEVKFWLGQKVGKQGYARIMRVQEVSAGAEESRSSDNASAAAHQVLFGFARSLGVTLQELGRHTCPDMVGFWLLGTASLRREWFGWDNDGILSPAAEQLRKKSRSFALYDALFRFQCYHRKLFAGDETKLDQRLALITRFAPCENQFPYRRTDAPIAAEWPEFAALKLHAKRQLLRDGTAWLFTRLLEYLARSPPIGLAALEWTLCRAALSATTLHALDLDGDSGLAARLRLLPEQISDEEIV